LDLRFGHSCEPIGYVTPEAEPRHITDPTVLGGSHFALSVEDLLGTLVVMVSKGANSVNPPAEVSRDTSAWYWKDHDRNCIELIEGKNSD